MRLADLVQKINPKGEEAYYKIKARIWHSPDLPKDIFVFLVICLVGFGAFLLGRISLLESEAKTELRIVQTEETGISSGQSSAVSPKATDVTWSGGDTSVSTKASAATNIKGMYVGSQSGTTYYLPWCGGVKRIHEENKVWFKSKEEAEAKGYRPAGNCKGI